MKSLRNCVWKLKNEVIEKDLLTQLMKNRNIENLDNFIYENFNLNWPKDEFVELKKAVNILIENKDKKIGIVGDYDVDGSSATAILVDFFKQNNFNFIYHIPNRFTEGYGISIPILKRFIEQKVEIVITVDNGTTAYEAINFMNQNNMKIIILDHHSIQNPIIVDALVNPHLYPNKPYTYMCATGVAFVFLSELNNELIKRNLIAKKVDMKQYLDIVACATVCDVITLTGLSRSFVIAGLKKILKDPHIVFKNLLADKIIDVKALGFSVGPYLNAPGRLGDASFSINLLLCKTQEEFNKVIPDVLIMNLERKRIEKEVHDLAIKKVDNSKKTIVVYDEDWHEGVIGIIAGRLKDAFYKPTCVMTGNEDHYKGSFRSTDNFDIGKFIKECINNKVGEFGGGHKLAGGISIKKEKINDFINFFEEYFNTNYIEIKEIIYYDAHLSLSCVNEETYNIIQKLAPYGEGNLEPIFLFTNCYIDNFYDVKELHTYFTVNYLNYYIHFWVFHIAKTSFTALRKKGLKIDIVGYIIKSLNNKIELSIIDVIVK